MIAGVAFATILAVVAGLVLSASAAVAHDVWSNIIRKGKESEHEEVVVAKIAAISIGAIAITVAVIGGSGLNVSFMVGLAFAVARQRQLPGAAAGAHLAALQHRGRRHRRAVRRDQLDRAGHRLAEGVAGRRHRHRLADRLGARRTRASSRSRSASSAAGWGRC